MSRRIKKKGIETQLHMRGNAEIEKWAEKSLAAEDPEGDLDIEKWESPPHIINGVPYEELMAQKEEEED
tara:strand:- start:303 stop:509 length:207 start_codon:yes stop_codon:yes gene_type:complete